MDVILFNWAKPAFGVDWTQTGHKRSHANVSSIVQSEDGETVTEVGDSVSLIQGVTGEKLITTFVSIGCAIDYSNI